ncbi:hypothetical protein LguiB_004199 [Lonicera macranthoides]
MGLDKIPIVMYTMSLDSWLYKCADFPYGYLRLRNKSIAIKGFVHWVSDIIVWFDLREEVFGDMSIPDSCGFGDGIERELLDRKGFPLSDGKINPAPAISFPLKNPAIGNSGVGTLSGGIESHTFGNGSSSIGKTDSLGRVEEMLYSRRGIKNWVYKKLYRHRTHVDLKALISKPTIPTHRCSAQAKIQPFQPHDIHCVMWLDTLEIGCYFRATFRSYSQLMATLRCMNFERKGYIDARADPTPGRSRLKEPPILSRSYLESLKLFGQYHEHNYKSL